MKIILIGATGTIGKAIDAELGQRHEIIRAGRNSGDVKVDIADPDSIRRFYAEVGSFDALVSATGKVHFGPLEDFTAEQLEIGLRNKLLGQVNLVLFGLKQVRDGVVHAHQRAAQR